MELYLIIGGIFIILGVVTSLIFLSKALEAIKTIKWPSVNGNLNSTELKTIVYQGVYEGGTRDGAVATVTNFQYSYSVDGTDYVGGRATMSDFVNKTGNYLITLQEKYKGRSYITVYYNPNNPSKSVLITGPSLYNFTPLITTIGFILMGAYICNLS